MAQKRSLSPYAFIAFPLAILFVFTLLPTLAGLGLSLFHWDGGGNPTWIGFENFTSLFADDKFSPALRNTLIFVILSVPPTVLIAFFVAAAVHAKWFMGKSIIRTLLFMPTIVSIVAIGFVWRWLLDDQAGLLNYCLGFVGVDDPPDWLYEGYWPLIWIIIVAIWRGIGFCLVLYLATLGNISPSLYEAAEIDGASRWNALRHITWPQAAPMTAFLLITGIIGALQVFDLVFVVTGQTETDYTNVLNLYIYRQFTYGHLGYASAIGVVIFALTIFVTVVQLWFFSRKEVIS